MSQVVQTSTGFSLEGAVNFDTAPSLLIAGQQLLAGRASVTIDLAKLTEMNSAIIPLLLAWIRAAAPVSCSIIHAPERLRGLLQASHLQEMIRVSI